MANETAHAGAYVDQALTRRNVTNPSPDAIVPELSGPTTLGPDTHSNAGDARVEPTIENPTAEVPPHSPPAWTPGRDYYANEGMAGQEFFDNQG